MMANQKTKQQPSTYEQIGHYLDSALNGNTVARGLVQAAQGDMRGLLGTAGNVAGRAGINYALDQANLGNSTSGSMGGGALGGGAARGLGAALGGADAGQVAEEAAWGAGEGALTKGAESLVSGSTPYVGAALGLGESLIRNGELTGKDASDAAFNAGTAAMGPWGLLGQAGKMFVDYKGQQDRKNQMKYGLADPNNEMAVFRNGQYVLNPIRTVNGRGNSKLATYQNMYANELIRRMNERMQTDKDYADKLTYLRSKGVNSVDVPLIAYRKDELDDLMNVNSRSELMSRAAQNADRFYGEGPRVESRQHYFDRKDAVREAQDDPDASLASRSPARLPHAGDQYMDEYYGYDANIPINQRGLSDAERQAYSKYVAGQARDSFNPTAEQNNAYQHFQYLNNPDLAASIDTNNRRHNTSNPWQSTLTPTTPKEL
jgi:hypothetical protein